MIKAGERQLQSAWEALTFARGEAEDKGFVAHVPADIDVKALRGKLKLSQTAFAARYGSAASRIANRANHTPDGAIRAYLLVRAREPQAVQHVLEAA